MDEDGDDAAGPLVVVERRQQQADVRQYEGDLHVQLDHPAKSEGRGLWGIYIWRLH